MELESSIDLNLKSDVCTCRASDVADQRANVIVPLLITPRLDDFYKIKAVNQ